MQWDNLEGQSYIVRQQYSTLTRSLEMPKTTESATAVHVPTSLMDNLRQQQAVREAKLRTAFWSGGVDLIFPSVRGGPISSGTINQILKASITAAGVRRLTFHGLRHTFISQLVRQGENIKVIQRKARHKNVQMTLDKYSHLFPDDSEAAGNRLDQRLFG